MTNEKIKEEDIKLIQKLRTDFQQVALTLGQLELRIVDMNTQKKVLLDEYAKLKEKEKEIAETFLKKYGEGQLNPTTWEFEKNTE